MNDRVTILDTRDNSFNSRLVGLISQHEINKPEVVDVVSKIICDVQTRGDEAIIEYTKDYDQQAASRLCDLELSKKSFEDAWLRISGKERLALQVAADRVFDFHQRQVLQSWEYKDESGNLLGQRVTPLDVVGIYVPGGKASYPSSVLMNAIPAKVAGVREIIMLVPAPRGELNDMVLAAAHLAGVDRAFTLGGAQAIAGLAYGTETLPVVDKIVGPGNQYVAEAKRQVFGKVGIDMIAGPSEILIICDGSTPVDWVVLDLFSQAEHDEDARVFLLCNESKFLTSVLDRIEVILPTMDRKDIISESLRRNGVFILTKDLPEAISISNRIAPEHLELSVKNPKDFLSMITSAGAIFLGKYTSESVGDYCAGPSHVLPTGGTARFASPLGVYDFQKRSSVIMCDEIGGRALCETASVLAKSESLNAHAASVEIRLNEALK